MIVAKFSSGTVFMPSTEIGTLVIKWSTVYYVIKMLRFILHRSWRNVYELIFGFMNPVYIQYVVNLDYLAVLRQLDGFSSIFLYRILFPWSLANAKQVFFPATETGTQWSNDRHAYLLGKRYSLARTDPSLMDCFMTIVHNTARDDFHADRTQRRGDHRQHASWCSSTSYDVSTAPLRIGREIFALI